MPIDMTDYKAFNPNRSDTSKGNALVPSLPAALRDACMDADQYLSTMARVSGLGVDFVGKAQAPVPSAYSYARIAYMPDANASGLMAWPGINPESLRKIVKENLIPRMVINQRKADVYRYSELAPAQLGQPGWRIEMIEHDKNPSRAIKNDMRDAERFIENCSRDYTYTQARERDANNLSAFSMYLAKTIEDLYTFDGWATWTDMDRAGRLRAFTNLPSGNIRLTFPGQGYKGDPTKFAALIDETGNPIMAFDRDELTWKVMCPRTDPDVMGYGYSITEQAVRLVQGFQGGIDLNCDTFTRSGIPNGMLLLMGDYWNQDQIDLLQREWQNMKKGQSKVWTVPVLAVPEDGDVKVLLLNDLKGTDLRYRDHLNLMAGAYCSIACFPVRRLGLFASGMSRDNEPVKGESMQVAGTDDPGLPRDLGFIGKNITEYFIAPNWPHLRFRFVNTDPKQDAREYELRRLSRTWGETRAEMDQDPLTNGVKADYKPLAEIMEMCPEDPSKIAAFQTLAVKYLELMMGDTGEGGEDGEGGGKDAKTPGAPFTSKIDPAVSETHGHASGVRRNSGAERRAAKVKEPA